MANIHQYANQAGYTAATDRPTNESNISLVGNKIVADGVNVVVAYKACNLKKGDAIAYDTVASKVVGIKNPLSSALDTTRFIIFGYYHGEVNGKGQVLSKTTPNTSVLWAQSHLYLIEPTLTANGGFKFTCSINGSSKSGTISWSANDTLASVVSQINTAAGATIAAAKGTKIGITINSYTNANFAITEATGATLDALSKYVTIDGVAQTETARSFQASYVKSLFPTLGYTGTAAEHSDCRMKNGGNGSYRSGANLARYMAYWQTNGASEYGAETGTTIINKATFESFATATGDAKALYDKYNGSWAAYMANRMADDENQTATNICELYYDNGEVNTAALASVMTKNLDGDWVPAYPAAYVAYNFSVADVPVAAAGKWHLPTSRDIVSFMADETYAAINASANRTSGTPLGNTNYYWSVSECRSHTAWCYYGYSGTLNYDLEFNACQVRPSLALPFES